MTIYPRDYVLTISLEKGISFRHIKDINVGAVYPWQMRCEWEGDRIILASPHMLDLVSAANRVGLAGGKIVSSTLQGNDIGKFQ